MAGATGCYVLSALLLLLCGVNACLRSVNQIGCEGDQCDRPNVNVPWKCGLCGVPIDVTLRVRNDIVEPAFDHTQVMKSVNTQELLHLLLGAANRNDAFRFKMTHWGAELGIMVDEISGLAADWSQNRYWRILFANGTGLSVGVSSYVPQNKDEIIFQYSVYEQGDNEK